MALSQTAGTKWEQFLDRFFIAGVVYRGISTYSRGGFLAAALVGAFSLWRAKHKIRTVVLVVLVAWGISAVMPQRFWDRMESITASEEERDASSSSRLYFWGLAAEMADDHPIFGVGFNGYRYAYDDYDVTGGLHGGSRTVHSSWFGVLSELGYPGIVLFVGILAGAVHSCHRIRTEARAHGLNNIVIYANQIQISVLVFMLGGTFLSAQYLELLWHVVGLTITLDNIHRRTVDDLLAKKQDAAAELPPAPVPVAAALPAPSRPRTRAGTSAGGRRYF
jgi:probable O-glycosylation ligase (exosortase A-associated)